MTIFITLWGFLFRRIWYQHFLSASEPVFIFQHRLPTSLLACLTPRILVSLLTSCQTTSGLPACLPRHLCLPIPFNVCIGRHTDEKADAEAHV